MTAPAARINLNDAEMFREGRFHEALREIRNSDPVYWNEGGENWNGFWAITKAEDVRFISRNPDLFISSRGIAGPGIRPEALAEMMQNDPANAAQATGGNVSIITMDPPRHVKMRLLVNKGFTPRAVNAMEPEIRRITNQILDNIAGRSECDFVLEVASQLPLAVICGMMGLDQKDWPLMFELTNKVLGSGDPEYQTDIPEAERGTPAAARQTAMSGFGTMFAYFREKLEDRRQNPRENDLISLLIQSELDGEKLTEMDLLQFCFLLLGLRLSEYAQIGGGAWKGAGIVLIIAAAIGLLNVLLYIVVALTQAGGLIVVAVILGFVGLVLWLAVWIMIGVGFMADANRITAAGAR